MFGNHLVSIIKRVCMTPEQYARHVGVRIGRRCMISTRSWGSEPFLIEIGDHVHITQGVRFITHDGAVWVFRERMPDLDVFGRIRILDNTFIGNHVIILPGVTIGRNCVIGAGAVVSKSIPDNVVAAGNPVRFVCRADEYGAKVEKYSLNTKRLGEREKRATLINCPEAMLMKRQPLQVPARAGEHMDRVPERVSHVA